jgi:4-hydroxybenzoate polyprenyltransferase
MKGETVPLPLSSRAFWAAYWVTLRPYLFFVSGVSGLVGASAVPRVDWVALVVAWAACFLSYGLGQALTDVSQVDTDRLSAPYRPLTQGLIGGRQVVLVSVAGLAACTAAVGVLNPRNLLLCGLAVAGLVSYTPLKRRWWGGPLWNAWIVALLPAIGYLGQRTSLTITGDPQLWAAIASVFFSYAVFVLLGYFKDRAADQATGYQTLVVKAGWRLALGVSAAFWLAAVTASWLLLQHSGLEQRPPGASEAIAALLWAGGVISLVVAHQRIARLRGEERRAHLGIAHAVRGYLLLHLGEAVALQPLLGGPALLYAVLFEIALQRRPERGQI